LLAIADVEQYIEEHQLFQGPQGESKDKTPGDGDPGSSNTKPVKG
jgi:hypothetical protein